MAKMLNRTLLKKLVVYFVLYSFLGSLFPAYAKSILKPDPKIFKSKKSILLEALEMESPDGWLLVFVFRVKGVRRPNFFAWRQVYDIEAKVTVEESVYQDKEVYKGVVDYPSYTQMLILRRDDFTPLYSIQKSKHTDYKSEVIFTGETIQFKTIKSGSRAQRSVKPTVIKKYYESELLPFVLAGASFKDEEARIFNLFHYGRSKHYQFEVRWVGVERVKVPAGEFDTYKLKVNPTGFLSGLSHNYIWYNNSPTYVVRGVKNVWWYLNETWELVKIDKKRKKQHGH